MYEPIYHLFPILVICCLFLARRIADAQLHRMRRVRESRTLKAMLKVELQSLLEHYHDNLALLSRGGLAPLSLRGAGGVFRSSANRLAGVVSPEVMVSLTSVYLHHDRTEALIQLCARARLNRNMVSNTLQANLDRLDERLVTGCRLIQAALEALGHATPNPYGSSTASAYADLTALEDESEEDAPFFEESSPAEPEPGPVMRPRK